VTTWRTWNVAQAARLWALDRHTSEGILERLAGAGFLFNSKEGASIRA